VIRAGSLDDLSQYKPRADIFTNQSPAWDCMGLGIPRFDEMPQAVVPNKARQRTFGRCSQRWTKPLRGSGVIRLRL